jgi:Ca2+-binding RTX toxin-like protein
MTVLTLEYGGTPYQNYLFKTQSEKLGFVPGFSVDETYSSFSAPVQNATNGSDVLLGTRRADIMDGLLGNDTIDSGDGNDILYGRRGNDTMNGGFGNDIMIGGAGADTLIGGNGTDTASYVDAMQSVTVALDGSLAGQGDAWGDTFQDMENVSGSRFNDMIVGNKATNSLFGDKGNDSLNGKGGNDTLRGGEGADTMTGGLGNDTFYFVTQLEANVGDVITDFSSKATGNNDRVALEGSAFGLTAASFTAANFQSGASDSALTADVRIFYETDTGILRYDADGNGAGAAITIATLTGAPTFTFSDVVIF